MKLRVEAESPSLQESSDVYKDPGGKKWSLRLGGSSGGSERWLDVRCWISFEGENSRLY